MLRRRKVKRNAGLVCLLLLFIACSQGSKSDRVVTPPPVPANGPRVVLPDGYVVQVEVAANDDTRAQGLMYRDRVREGSGMLFFFNTSEIYPFWMKNTIIPLDMIWIAEDQKVVDVKAGVPPCQADPCPSYPPSGKARYVLELGSGVAAQHRVTPGSQLRIEGTEQVVIR
jgi:uncharacterized protein